MQSAKTDQPAPSPPKTSGAGTDTGEGTRTATGTTETTAKQSGVGASVGEKIRGAVNVIHGAGEELRGSILGAFDTARGKDVSQTEASRISGKGMEEIYKGMETLRPGHYARKEERERAKTGGAPAAEAQESQHPLQPQRDEPVTAVTGAARAEPERDVPGAKEKQAPPPPRNEAATAGAGLGKDPPQAQESQPVPLQREEATTGSARTGASETKTGPESGEYHAPSGVRDNQSTPGNVAVSRSEGQGVSQGMGGSPEVEYGPPPLTTL